MFTLSKVVLILDLDSHALPQYLKGVSASGGLSIPSLCPNPTLTMICNPQFNYNQYYLSQQLSSSHYHAAMGNDMNSNMQQGQSPQPHINSDPSLQLYYSGYDSFQNGQHQNQQLPSLMIPQQPPMNVVAHSPHSSSSQASDYAGTPTLDGEGYISVRIRLLISFKQFRMAASPLAGNGHEWTMTTRTIAQ